MAHVDTYYRLKVTAPFSEALLERVRRVRAQSRLARTHTEKKKLGGSVSANDSQASASDLEKTSLDHP